MENNYLSNCLRGDSCYPTPFGPASIRPATKEEMEKAEAEAKAYHEKRRKIDIACCVIEIVRELIIRHKLSTAAAFVIAKELVSESQNYLASQSE